MATLYTTIGEQELELEVSAFTLIVYEDRFKGRRFLQDVEVLTSDNIPFGITAKFLWSAVKTADENVCDFNEWIKQFEIADIILLNNAIISLISESLSSIVKKD